MSLWKKDQKSKEQKLSEEVNKALAMGDGWRDHTTVMQAIHNIPDLLSDDLKKLDEILKSFFIEGGKLESEELDGHYMYTIEYKDVKIRVAFERSGKKKFYTVEDFTPGETPKKVIQTIGNVISTHYEISKRIFAKQIITEILAYLEDDATKDSVQHIVRTYKDNGEVLFNAINGHSKIFDIDMSEVLGEKK